MGNEQSTTSLFIYQSTITTKQGKNNKHLISTNQQKINFYIKKKDENKLLKEKEVCPIAKNLITPVLNEADFTQHISTYSPTFNEINRNSANMRENKQQREQRTRSVSLCTVQLKENECQPISGYAFGNTNVLNTNARKSSFVGYSQTLMPTLTRLRIQQSFRNAKPLIGHKILKRASTLRTEFKIFINNLNNGTVDQLAINIFRLVTDCVANIDFPSKIASTSFAFGKIFAQLCVFGFRPDLFSTIADAMVAECVKDGGAQKRCETLIAWSHLMQFIFSNVRDGYYAEVRQQRRSSLPQQRLFLKQKYNLNTATARGSL